MRRRDALLVVVGIALVGCGGGVASEEQPRGSDAPPERFTNSIGMVFVRIPAGTFRMGHEPGEEGAPTDKPAERVTIHRDYHMSVHEVTNAQFRHFRPNHDSGYRDGRDAQGTLNADDQPAVRVSWHGAAAFCEWLSDQEAERRAGRRYRLPTEAQWERAARAGRSWKYPWGDHWPAEPDQANLLEEETADGHALVAPVGSYRPNPFGLYDMAGNVWEWCATDYAPQPEHKIIKGASWDHHSRLRQRSAAREHLPPDSRWYDVGLRIVCEVEGE